MVSVLCGGNNERCVLTALSVSVTSSSVAQVDSSLEKKLTPQQVLSLSEGCIQPKFKWLIAEGKFRLG